MRELEYYLHTLYADVKLPGRDNFSLKVTDVMTLASWFDGGMWEGNHLSLADYSGRSPSSLAERGRLLGEAAKTVLFAEEMREFKDRLNQRDLREELWSIWNQEVAEAWKIPCHDVTLLIITGQIDPQIDRARKSIEAGRSPRIPPRPHFLNSSTWKTGTTKRRDDDLAWIENIPLQ